MCWGYLTRQICNSGSQPNIYMSTLDLCLKVCGGKQEKKEWGVVDLTGSRDVEGLQKKNVGRSTSLFLSSSSSPVFQSSPDRKSLIGNEPWRHSHSRDQQIATTYRLWRGGPSPSHRVTSLLCLPPSLSSSLTPSVYREFMIYLRQCRGHGHQEQQSILLLLICQTRHLLYSTLTGPDIPALT